jgi:tetratricopeptide (TPR) repeat protein
MLYIIIWIILIISLLFLLFILIKKIPELKILDFSNIPKEKQENIKLKILESKFLRQTEKTQNKLSKFITPIKSNLSNTLEKLQDKVSTIERKYTKKRIIDEATKTKSINELFVEADDFIEKEKFMAAEKALIEIISRDKKNPVAYEKLGEMYMLDRNYHQAEEIIKYLIKLKTLEFKKSKGVSEIKNNKKKSEEHDETEMIQEINADSGLSRYYDDLGDVYEKMDKKEKALDCYLKANALEPNNPKYLDKIIELAITVKDIGLAKKTFRRLKSINPENGKLNDFKEVLDKIK